jgi:hypothetical protein
MIVRMALRCYPLSEFNVRSTNNQIQQLLSYHETIPEILRGHFCPLCPIRRKKSTLDLDDLAPFESLGFGSSDLVCGLAALEPVPTERKGRQNS